MLLIAPALELLLSPLELKVKIRIIPVELAIREAERIWLPRRLFDDRSRWVWLDDQRLPICLDVECIGLSSRLYWYWWVWLND